MENNAWLNGMLEMARIGFESGLKSMNAFEAHAKTTLKHAADNADLVQEEAKKAIDTWIDSVAKARSMYEQSVEEGFKTLEKYFSSGEKK